MTIFEVPGHVETTKRLETMGTLGTVSSHLCSDFRGTCGIPRAADFIGRLLYLCIANSSPSIDGVGISMIPLGAIFHPFYYTSTKKIFVARLSCFLKFNLTNEL